MATIGQDNFTEAVDTALSAHTPDVGAGWTLEAANFTIVAADDNVSHSPTVIEMARKGDAIGDDDMDVTASVKTSDAALRRAGVCGRMTSANFDNAYQAYLQGSSNGSTVVDVYLFKEVGGTRTQLGFWDGNLAENTFVTLKLQIRAATKKVFIDGTERISSTDDSLIGNQYAGIIMNGNANAFIRLDNFLSESLATQFTASPADTAGLTETVIKQARLARAETAGLTEGMARASRKAVADALSLLEGHARQIGKAHAETLQLTEQLTTVKVVLRDLAETLTPAESLTRLVQKANAMAETVSLLESLAKRTDRPIAEVAGLAEAHAAVKTVLRSTADTLAPSESLDLRVGKHLEDAVQISEAVARMTARLQEETVGLTEAEVRQARRAFAEQLAFSEALARQVLTRYAETAALSEADEARIAKAIVEALGLTEDLIRSRVKAVALAEAAGLTELLTSAKLGEIKQIRLVNRTCAAATLTAKTCTAAALTAKSSAAARLTGITVV